MASLGDKQPTEKGAPDRIFFLILFDDVMPPIASDVEATSKPELKNRNQSDQETGRLRQELASTRDALRSAIESEDSFKEEFQSANEEILSANEELQSTNEELETSKEELQSVNEELNTLNAELRNKNNELHDLSNDILNLLNKYANSCCHAGPPAFHTTYHAGGNQTVQGSPCRHWATLCRYQA